MRITVVGPGALGCLFAAMLAKEKKNTVWLLDHREERAAHLNKHGLSLQTKNNEIQVALNSTVDCKIIGQTDAAILAVKSQDVGETLSRIKAVLAESKTLLIALQNGIGHHEPVQDLAHYAIGITAQGATLTGHGKVIHGGMGQTTLGYLPNSTMTDTNLLDSVASVFSEAGMPSVVSKKILNAVWNKLIVNVGINALTAIHNCKNGELLSDPDVLQTQKSAVLEAVKVARAKGIKLSDDPVEMTRRVCQATKNNVSSMLQDIRKGKQTEIDAINGAIAKEGKQLGIPTPCNEELIAAVHKIETTQ